MSANAGTIQAPPRSLARSVLALTAALVLGAAAGSVATRAVVVDPTTEVPVVGIVPWDQQKLDAMNGRQAAEIAGMSGIAPWDEQKLEAMEGLQAAAGR
jgi:hypothetical protein